MDVQPGLLSEGANRGTKDHKAWRKIQNRGKLLSPGEETTPAADNASVSYCDLRIWVKTREMREEVG